MKDDIHILHDHFLISLIREDCIEFRKMDIEPMPNTRSSHTEPPKPMITFSGHTTPTTFHNLPGLLLQINHGENFQRGLTRSSLKI